MGWRGNRSRTVRKTVTFSEEEWRWVADSLKVENRQRIRAGLRPVGWMAFARNRIRCAHRVNITVPANLHDVSAQLARIGNNVNQIARHANTVRETDLAMLSRVFDELRRAERLVAGLSVRVETDVDPKGVPEWL